MNENIATQIASLINTENHLTVTYTAEKVANSNFLFAMDANDRVVACVELRKVQWYQVEICHLSVIESMQGQGFGKKMLQQAIEFIANETKFTIAQATIRTNNPASEHLFGLCGFIQTVKFINPATQNEIGVWQKVL